jgi:L-aminopeptidase/D-esterase-like protein
MVVNPWGDVLVDGVVPGGDAVPADPFVNTTIGVLATNAVLTKGQCLAVAKAGHAGMARSIFPAHSPFDGDALVVAATNQVETTIERVVPLADRAVAAAVVASVSDPT